MRRLWKIVLAYKCQMCNGSGEVGQGKDRKNCPNCGGTGEIG